MIKVVLLCLLFKHTLALCGDGHLEPPGESCDDGNRLSGDGCSPFCQFESGFTCAPHPLWPTLSLCTETPGKGRWLGALGCDDGNTVDGDGCNGSGAVEDGWLCTQQGVAFGGRDQCEEVCGDGKDTWGIKMANRCDDGNNIPGDGCSSSCYIEPGFKKYQSSNGTLFVREICGEGIDHQTLGCDDGNTLDGDGCSSNCTVEVGYRCRGGTLLNPDRCEEICGDGSDHH